MHYTENGFVKITDSALVSYLTIKGYQYAKIEVNNGQGIFLFSETESLNREIAEFYRNAGGYLQFHKSYRQTLRDINNAVREQGNGK